jgi:hypothetical protein
MYRYNISLDDYIALNEQQNNRCAICSISFILLKKRPAVDHSHETGKIRGLLCNDCNSGIGFLKDNTEILKAAHEYLLKTTE